MADGEASAATTPKVGKTINFNLTGDDHSLYTTLREVYEGDREAEEERFAATLAGLPAEARALIESRLAPATKKDMSYREFFVKAMRDALAHQEALADAADAEEASESEGE